MSPPNIKEIARFVQPVIIDMGLSATKQRIMEIAEEVPFKQARVKIGSRSGFPPFCAESFRKSRAEN
jgi:hypothetical protein